MFKLERKSCLLAFSLVWACLAGMAGRATGIEIVAEEVVQVVENGTEDALVLDCPYEIGDFDREGFLIKWYHTNNPIPVYQWIHGSRPQSQGILTNRLDLEYVAKDEEFHRHRALYLLFPTTELTGEYICQVSSFEDEKEYRQKLIVYNKPAEVLVWTEQAEGNNTIRIFCEVEDIFPEPELAVHAESESDNRSLMAGAKEVKSWSEGLYSAMVELQVEEDDLDGPVNFVCEVTIPDTDLLFFNATKFEPKVEIKEQEVLSGVPTTRASVVFVGLATLLSCLVFSQ